MGELFKDVIWEAGQNLTFSGGINIWTTETTANQSAGLGWRGFKEMPVV